MRRPEPAPEERFLDGELEHEGRRLRARLTVASRHSLYATLSLDEAVDDRTEFSALRVKLGEEESALGRCRLQYEYTKLGRANRLIFLDEIYDCRALVDDHKIIAVKNFFQNLPLVLEAKEKIRPEFRDYVAATLYDLSVYKKFFNEQDRLLSSEPPLVSAAGQEAILRSERKHFYDFFDARLAELDRLTVGFDREEHERHGFYLRRMAWDFILGSEFLKRTNLKPRGYAGDAEMMQMLYENRYVGHYVFNKLIHKHPVETPAAQAVRNRRALVARELAQLRKHRGPSAKLKLLSVACGPAWELQDIFHTIEDAAALEVTLLDQDPSALRRAQECVARLEAARGFGLSVHYVADSVRTMLRTPKLTERFGRFDFIYSMGLFDYLTPPVARAVLTKLWELVEPGGRLLVGNYHVGNPTRNYMAYWMDWVLYYRTEPEFLALANGLAKANAAVQFDESRCQMFLLLDKRA